MSRPRAHSPPVIMLYDVPGSTPQPWAPNIWRIRFILNYKRLRYRTIWVEFPDVEPTLRALGAPPSARRPDGRSVYTLPVIVDPTPAQAGASPVILSNATTIAEYLETRYPARAVFPEGSRALQTLFVHHVQETLARSLLPRFAGWRVGLLAPDPALADAFPGRRVARFALPHGGLRVHLFLLELC